MQKEKKKLHQYCETCLLSTLPSCHQTVVLCPMLDFPCPQAWKEDHFVTMSYGRAHHILLSKCHSKAIPTPEKPEQHGYVAVCILLMNSHVSCFRKPFLLYSCHFHGIKDSPRPFGCWDEKTLPLGVLRKHCSSQTTSPKNLCLNQGSDLFKQNLYQFGAAASCFLLEWS